MDKYLIYGLVDPVSKELRYIGRSSSGLIRPKKHSYPSEMAKKANTRVSRWIKRLGRPPEIVVLESWPQISNEALNEREIWHISYWRNTGANLCNHARGGAARYGFTTPAEVRAKQSAALRGRKQTPEQVEPRISKLRRPVIDDLGNSFRSMSDAARYHKIGVSSICSVLKGRRTNVFGRIFKYG